MSAIEVAKIAQGGDRRAGLQQKMVAGDPGIAWNAEVAIIHPSE